MERYEYRPPELGRLSYAEYMANSNPTKNTKRNRSAVMKWHSYPESDVLNFKHEHVLLFHPFRKELEILDCNKLNDIFDTNCQAVMQVKKTFTHNVDVNNLIEMCDRIIAVDRECGRIYTLTKRSKCCSCNKIPRI
ncbi:hypothetical protein MTO96_023847 [Rhipicephalus appendiculatus]